MKRITKVTIVGLVAIALLAAILSGVWVADVALANGGPGGRGGGGGGGDTVVVEAAATALGMTVDELKTALRTSTLADIAAARGVDPNTVEAAIVAAKKAQIDQLSASLDLNALFAALGGGGPRGGGPIGTPHPTRTPGPTRTPTP